ncbi:hypothetical protein HHI36_022185 [Cryptolaemus montrouzieri]|uniref:Alpha-ketoglutarate-dependent dioxygenase ABH7 n=1 Tax=Cryptolaemus montrouzieri TaxID=559131 RepID=A0ABD2N0D2_9CUCU
MIFSYLKKSVIVPLRLYSLTLGENQVKGVEKCPEYIDLCHKFQEFPIEAEKVIESMKVYRNFLSLDEEKSILEEIEPYMSKLKYEFDHWDDAIHGYRETERLKWNNENAKILNRVREIAFPSNVPQIKYVHILDLAKDGYIKPHIDAIRL